MNILELDFCPICDDKLFKLTHNIGKGVRTLHNGKNHIFCVKFAEDLTAEAMYLTIKKYSINWEFGDKKPIKIMSVSSSNSQNWIVELPHTLPEVNNLKDQFNLFIKKYELAQLF